MWAPGFLIPTLSLVAVMESPINVDPHPSQEHAVANLIKQFTLVNYDSTVLV